MGMRIDVISNHLEIPMIIHQKDVEIGIVGRLRGLDVLVRATHSCTILNVPYNRQSRGSRMYLHRLDVHNTVRIWLCFMGVIQIRDPARAYLTFFPMKVSCTDLFVITGILLINFEPDHFEIAGI